MATFISHDERAARVLLEAAGVTLLREDDPDRQAVMDEVLDDASRFDREVASVLPPAVGSEFTASGAWHINSANEFHSVLTGRGILEFMTAEGAVSVVLEAGDIMAVRRAEHRYLPLTAQDWMVRFAGGPTASLVQVDTGRPGAPFPTLA